jgi:hypothetical protein
MIGFRRGGVPPFIPLLIAVAFGYMLAGGAGSAVGALLFLPLLVMKVLFMLFLFGMLFRFAGGGPWGRRWSDRGGHHGPPWADRGRWTDHRDRTASTTEGGAGDDIDDGGGKDWEEAVRAAKREIDRLFPDPRE